MTRDSLIVKFENDVAKRSRDLRLLLAIDQMFSVLLLWETLMQMAKGKCRSINTSSFILENWADVPVNYRLFGLKEGLVWFLM